MNPLGNVKEHNLIIHHPPPEPSHCNSVEITQFGYDIRWNDFQQLSTFTSVDASEPLCHNKSENFTLNFTFYFSNWMKNIEKIEILRRARLVSLLPVYGLCMVMVCLWILFRETEICVKIRWLLVRIWNCLPLKGFPS